MNRMKNVIALLAALLFAVPFAQAADEAGVVLYAVGTVTATGKDGVARELARRSPVYSGDLLRTGSGARAQVRFSDGGIVALKPASELRLDDYRYQSAGGSANVMSLLKGGFRTMTGAIGKLDKAAYKVNTPVATIGIRGTLYETWFDESSGLSLGVWDGGITACNDSGCLDLGMNADHRFGFIPVGGKPAGQDGEPDGIGATRGNTGDASAMGEPLIADTGDLGLSSGDALGQGLFGPPQQLSHADYPQLGYAMIAGSGVVAADFAQMVTVQDPQIAGLYTVDSWSLIDNASGIELSSTPPPDSLSIPQAAQFAQPAARICDGKCTSWYATVYTNSTTGSQVVWGQWNEVYVGLSAGDPNPALSVNNGTFVLADYLSPADATAYIQQLIVQQSPVLYMYLANGSFDMSGIQTSNSSGNITIDVAANTVSGYLSVSDYNNNNWSVNMGGGVHGGALDLNLTGGIYTPNGAVAGQERQAIGNIEGQFYGRGTIDGVIGGVDLSTVGSNPLSGKVETLKGIFLMPVGVGG